MKEFECEYYVRAVINGKWVNVGHYKNLVHLLNCHSEKDLAAGYFSCNIAPHNTRPYWMDTGETFFNSRGMLSVYDQFGNYMSTDRLVGYKRDVYHQWWLTSSCRWWGWSNGAKRNRHRGSSCRLIKTKQERTIACDEDHKRYSRCKRHTNAIPNSWDDIWKHRDKNWKRTRKTQYRNVDKRDA